MTRGRKRKFDKTIPEHIDQKKIPTGAYWNRRDRYWYALVDGAKPRLRRLGGEETLMSELHQAMEAVGGIDRDCLDFVFAKFEDSQHFLGLSQSSQTDYRYCRSVMQKLPTKLGVPFARLKLSAVTLPLFQRLLDAIGEKTPSTAAHVKRYASVAFAWGMARGYCKTNPAEGSKPPKEKKAHRMPEQSTMRAVIALFRQRGELPSRRPGSLPPYIWAAAELAYRLRMRSVEVRRLTDAEITDAGINVDRVKGSLGNLTRWSPELRDAHEWLLARRARIWASKKLAIPMRADARPLIVNESGQPLTKGALNSAWRRAMAIAIDTGLLDEKTRFGMHGLKHRGITDTPGTRGQKQQASGHRQERMLDTYDHERPVVDPAGKA